MANHASHGALPYPIKNARFTVHVPYLDADGDPTAPTTPDTEISVDNGAAADCTEEVSVTSGMDGMSILTLTGAEMNCSMAALNAKAASGPKATLLTIYPRVLPILESGTAQAGASGSITLAAGAAAYDLKNCFVRTTGGTGGGGGGGVNNQARKIIAYNSGTKVATVDPTWETTPDGTTTYDILLPEGVTEAMVKTLIPATAGRTALIDTGGNIAADLKLWLATAPLALTSQRPMVQVDALTNDIITATKIATGAIDADAVATDAVNEIRDAIKALVVETEGSYTLQQALSIVLAAVAGRSANSGLTFKTPNNAADRIVAAVDGSNNRTAMTLTPSA